MKTTNKYYDRLREIQAEHPELTFNNDGYEYISHGGKEAEVAEITEILKATVRGFKKFNNFKPLKDGTFAIRCQYDWGAVDNSRQFIGVGYFNIDDFKDFEITEK